MEHKCVAYVTIPIILLVIACTIFHIRHGDDRIRREKARLVSSATYVSPLLAWPIVSALSGGQLFLSSKSYYWDSHGPPYLFCLS